MGNFNNITDYFNYGDASSAHTLIYGDPKRGAEAFRALIDLMESKVANGEATLYGIGLDLKRVEPEDRGRRRLFDSLSPADDPDPTLAEVTRLMDIRAEHIHAEFYTDRTEAQRLVAQNGIRPAYLFINDLSRLLSDGDAERSVVERVLTVGRSYGVYLVAMTPSVKDEAIRRVRDNIMSELIIEPERRKLSPYFRDLLSDAGTIEDTKN